MIVVLLVIGGFFLFSEEGGNITGATVYGDNGNVQVVKMHVEGPQYVFEPSSVKKGIPVKIEADMSKMPGCSKSVIISEFNARKVFNNNDNTMVFTPDKAGTFYVACSMNMYKGQLTVLESDGTSSSYVQTAPSGGSCGAAGGGCGCGG